MKWSEFTEEQRENYRAKAREYKKANKEKIKAQRKQYDIEYYKNLTSEQKEKRNEYKKEFRKKQKALRPPKPKKVDPEKPIKKTYLEIFFEKAKLKHNNKYDYSLTQPVNSKTMIKIICPIHGEFEQRANDHLQGYGCMECGGKKRLTTNEFILKAKAIHGDKYDYSKVEYVASASKVKLICPIHGEFEQKPNNHLNGKGCKKCGLDYGVWSYSLWEEKGLKSSYFDSFKLYIIECWNDEERFIKIGKTFKSVAHRFKGKKYMPYDFKLIKMIEGSAKEISELELELKNKNKINSYLPKKEFNGRYECYNYLIFS